MAFTSIFIFQIYKVLSSFIGNGHLSRQFVARRIALHGTVSIFCVSSVIAHFRSFHRSPHSGHNTTPRSTIVRTMRKCGPSTATVYDPNAGGDFEEYKVVQIDDKTVECYIMSTIGRNFAMFFLLDESFHNAAPACKLNSLWMEII